MHYFKELIIMAILSAGTQGAQAAAELDTQLQVTGLRSQKGTINVAVFHGAEGFPADPSKAFRRLIIEIPATGLPVTKLSLPEGSYAISLFHDEDGDGVLKKNMFGVPVEGLGFSNNPKWRMAPPNYDACKLVVTGQEIVVHVKY